MKKFLPFFFLAIFFLELFLLPTISYAQNNPQGQAAPNQQGKQTQQRAPTLQGKQQSQQPPTDDESIWVNDPEVTFIGKNAARSASFLNWAIRNYNWACVTTVSANGGTCDDSNNPIQKTWLSTVNYIVSPLLALIILTVSTIIVVTRGRSLTVMSFLPQFVGVVLLIFFSYSLVHFLYQMADLMQSFFLRTDITKTCPPNCISQKDLLVFSWNYEDFVGQRLISFSKASLYAESSFMSLLLIKLTTATYFVMGILLSMRKLVLWFFLIVSPLFPVLLLYKPLRISAKVWIGEFFRWLLYAPLFAIFLKGLLFLWKNTIPLTFTPIAGKAELYPTSINILLGGPKQLVSPTNSLNLPETFALYIVALLMLWIVILLPWVLLQIVLDTTPQFKENNTALMNAINNYATKVTSKAFGGGVKELPPSPSHPAGQAIELPFKKKFAIPQTLQPSGGATKGMALPPPATASSASNQQNPFFASKDQQLRLLQINADVLRVANTQLPSIRDIAKYETSFIAGDNTQKQSNQNVIKNLQNIANPAKIANPAEREKFQQLRDKLIERKQHGDPLAAGILNAAQAAAQNTIQPKQTSLRKVSANQIKHILQQIANPSLAQTDKERQKLTQLHDKLVQESRDHNNQLASAILSTTDQTSIAEVEKIRQQLFTNQDKKDSLASSVSSVVYDESSKAQKTEHTKNVIQQVINPESSPENRETFSKLHTDVVKASQGGNSLATTILSFTKKSIEEIDIERLQEKIMEAKAKGDPLATEIAQMTTDNVSVPIINRVQTVSQEDYHSVKNMWKANYKDLAVPLELNETRTDWIKDDIGNMDEIVGLLSSTDQEKAAQGLREVSHILPFLMIGGFSQTEIISYLKAKREAAKEALDEINTEEDTKVDRETKKEEDTKKMEHTIEEESTDSVNDNSGKEEIETKEEKPLKDVLAEEEQAEQNKISTDKAKQP